MRCWLKANQFRAVYLEPPLSSCFVAFVGTLLTIVDLGRNVHEQVSLSLVSCWIHHGREAYCYFVKLVPTELSISEHRRSCCQGQCRAHRRRYEFMVEDLVVSTTGGTCRSEKKAMDLLHFVNRLRCYVTLEARQKRHGQKSYAASLSVLFFWSQEPVSTWLVKTIHDVAETLPDHTHFSHICF